MSRQSCQPGKISASLIPLLTILLVACPMQAQQEARPPRAEATGEPLTPDWCRQLPRPRYKNLERVSVESNWFEVYRIRPGVFAIYEPHQYEEVISYLIVGSKRALLFDTGLGIGDIQKLVAQLTPLPVTVLNSHTHFDHTGSNWQFANIMGLDTPYTHQNEAGATHEEVQEVVLPERFCGNPPPGFEPSKYEIRPFRVTRRVKDGEVIDLGGRRLEVIRTPGHTPDALCLLDRKNKLLFTGDTFYAGPIFLYVPETNLADYERSVEGLAKLVPQLDLLLTGHNFPAERPEMLVRLNDAFQQIRAGTAPYRMDGRRREYLFDGFSMFTAVPDGAPTIPKPEICVSPRPRVKVVQGVVTAPLGVPIKGTKLALLKGASDGASLAETLTDSEGQFEFPKMPPGKYYLSVVAPGFKKFVGEISVSRFSSAKNGIMLQLSLGVSCEVVEVKRMPQYKAHN